VIFLPPSCFISAAYILLAKLMTNFYTIMTFFATYAPFLVHENVNVEHKA